MSGPDNGEKNMLTKAEKGTPIASQTDEHGAELSQGGRENDPNARPGKSVPANAHVFAYARKCEVTA